MSAEWWQTVGQWEELFDRKYAPSSKDGCWNWIGAKSGNACMSKGNQETKVKHRYPALQENTVFLSRLSARLLIR